jgi:PAS domain S-box-containing protein
MKELEFQNIEEEVAFYKAVLNALPSFVNVNEVKIPDDPSSSHSIWSNQQIYDFMGYSREEVKAMGFAYFVESMHPEDIALVADGYERFKAGTSTIYGGFLRIRPKNGDYHWFVGGMSVLEMKDGKPWRILANVQNLENMTDTRNQIIQLVKENLKLKHQLKISNLTRREQQIIKLIANSKTEKEIALELSISPATAKTHRHHIMQKLQLKNKAALTSFAIEHGLD